MGYTEDDRMVRVDFFRQSGKWYTTVALKWDRYSGKDEDGRIVELFHETFDRCLKEQFYDLYVRDRMIAVCLEPYHEYSHLIMRSFNF